MSIHPTLPGLFEPVQTALPLDVAPATDKQIAYARTLAARTGRAVPTALFGDRAGLSAWIDRAKPKAAEGRFSAYPSAKQVQFAERIARLKRREVPPECFKDKSLMARWIDGNKPR
ncbi:hypothetical protein [uncultured Tateyamaria sp.]|uniref:hypothetical protein n=1 Tax=uncultured Tateyamaria sp. TaxID=455651 RepID=UPI00260B1958|nr:hypothetical protein [uncultured Tateyamaria sp.]